MTTYRYIDKTGTIQQQGLGNAFTKIKNKKNNIIKLQKIKKNMLQR